ncbi:hypothetical protein [Tessaracoccus antarcticus]|uniref:Uncharacterized protein n=1 Tax=Tessaracoccus antarcticus TaxID=2479848 RepID=A0A3M0GLW7_9ACTN|nr:hypothetical protein [Tessaracoccus antarcticus]RMB62169.1 hypothetical protein EAX62_06285 [Tessaracoccus antarcticus]
MSTTLQRIAIISAGLVFVGSLTGCGAGLHEPTAVPLPAPTPGAMPLPAPTDLSPQAGSPASAGLPGHYVLKTNGAVSVAVATPRATP